MKNVVKVKNKPIRISHALAVHDKKEEARVLKVLREHRTMMGKEVEEFEKRIAKLFGKKYGIMVNSGSSANLLAVELLELPPGSEVITPILTFATTIAPLVQKGLVPVFIDVVEGKYTIDEDKIESAISKKTKALMIPTLMGNLPDLERIRKIANKYKLLYIDDSCDSLGSLYKNKPTGVYSDISTTSTYGSHIITSGGNGGLLMVDSEKLRDKAKMLRGWGRSSAIFAESENLKDRFGKKLNNIPYDGKFIFEMIGYNFLPMEMGAAFGNVQLDKLKGFIEIRDRNTEYLIKFFNQYPKYFITPKIDKGCKARFLYFPITIKKEAPFTRLEFVTYLEENNIQTRPIFTGNILTQPGFENIFHRKTQKNFPVTESIMAGGVLLGTHQGLTIKHLDRVISVVEEFLHKFK